MIRTIALVGFVWFLSDVAPMHTLDFWIILCFVSIAIIADE